MARMDDDLLLSIALRARFQGEADQLEGRPGALWWACVERGAAPGQFRHFQNGYAAEAGERLASEHLVTEANRLLHHDGAWVAQWCLQGRHMNMIWLDQDGDAQFTVEFDEDAYGLVQVDLHHWLEQLEGGWQSWRRLMVDVLDPKTGQTFKRAQGQRRPSSETGAISRPILGDIVL